MASEFPYIKVPGRRQGVLVSGSLWLGADHLLSVKNLRFTEDYRRYAYRDIQGIVIHKTPRFYLPSAVLWGLLAWTVCEIAVLARQQFGAGKALLLIPGAEILWLLYAGLLRSCRCHIQTAVSREELPALVRLGHARRAVGMISAKVTELQGALPEGWTVDETQASPVPLRITEEDQPEASLNTGMWCAFASFILLMIDAGFTYYHSQHVLNHGAQIGASVLMLVEASIMVLSLVLLRRAKVVRNVRNLVIASLVFAGVTYYFSATLSPMLESLRRGGMSTSISISYWIDVVNETGNMVLGVVGVAAWSSARKKMPWPS